MIKIRTFQMKEENDQRYDTDFVGMNFAVSNTTLLCLFCKENVNYSCSYT